MMRTKTSIAPLLLVALLGCADTSNMSFAPALSTWRHSDIEGDAFICVPKGKPPFPAIVLNHGIFVDQRGLSAAMKRGYSPGALCQRFANDGFLAFLPVRRSDVRDMKAHLREVMAAVGAVRARPDVDRDRVTLGGHSRGGLLSLMAAIRGAPARSYILLAPAPGRGGLFAKLLGAVHRIDAPILVMVERSDKFSEIKEAVSLLEEAFRAAGTPHKVIWYDRGGGHDLFLSPGYYWSDMMNFLRNPP
jgi:dienelactone hydrolase